MTMLNKKYDICIEILTPLSIGAGSEKDWTKGLDYVEKDGEVFKLNLHKMIASGIDVNKITSCIEKKDSNGLLQLIGRKLSEVADKKMELPVSSSQDIKSFVKNQLSGLPIVPGSSIKGAVRSILFNHLRINETTEKEVFGSSIKGDEFMRFLKFSDVDFDETALVNTKIYNLDKKEGRWIGGWKHSFVEGTNGNYKPTGFNTVYEALVPSQIGYGTLMLSEMAFESLGMESHTRGKQKKELFSLTNLFKVINEYTRNYLRKEREFFLSYPTDKSDEIVKGIDELLKQIPIDNSSCLFKMSAGSGFHSITGDWQFDNYVTGTLDRKRNRGNVKPKSRKIAIYKENEFMLMGFVKIIPLSSEESEAIALEKKVKFDEYLKDRKAIEERNRKERKESERLEFLQRQQQKKCEDLMDSACNLFEEKKYEEALSLAYEIELIDSSYKNIKSLIQNIVAKLNAQKLKQEAEELQKRVEEMAKAQYNMPLSDKIGKVNKLPTLFGNIKTWMKQNKRNSLTLEELMAVKNKIVQIYGLMKIKEQTEWKIKIQKWENLSILIGQDLVKQWLDEL